MILKIILIIVIVMFVLSLITGAVTFFIAVVRPKVDAPDEPTPDYYKDHEEMYQDGLSFIKSHAYKNCTLTSRDGLLLQAVYFENPAAKRVVIFAHGYHGSPVRDFSAQLSFFYARGCSLFLIFERCHGKSEGRYITYGMRESEDIADWAQAVADYPENENMPLYLEGMSLGAASVMMSTLEKLPETLRGLIVDCGYANAWEQVTDTAKRIMHMPSFPFMYIMNGFCRIFAGYSLRDKSPEEAMRKNTRIPVLFIQGTDDRMVLPHNTIRDYMACAAKKRLVMAEGADHTQSFSVDTVKVRTAICELIGETYMN